MSRYRIEVTDTYTVQKVYWIDLDAQSIEDAEQLLEHATKNRHIGTEDWDTLPALQEALIRIHDRGESHWDHEYQDHRPLKQVPDVPDPRQTTLFGG